MDVSTAIATTVFPSAAPMGLSAGLSNGQMVLIVGILGITALMIISTRRRLREARNSPKAYAREQIARLRDEHAVVQDMEEVMVHLEEFARGVQGRIDTRFAKLEAVIRDADERIDRLERLVRHADGAPALDVTIDGQSPDADNAPIQEDDLRQRSIYEWADEGQTPLQIAEQTGQSLGEIELILALRKTTPASPV